MKNIFIWLLAALLPTTLFAEDTTTNKSTSEDTESPMMLYVVPWGAGTPNKNVNKLVLPDVFGELFDPLTPREYEEIDEPIATLKPEDKALP